MTALDASSELSGIATVIKEGNDGNAICQHMDLDEESSPGSSGQNESLRQDGVFCHWSQSSQLDIVSHTSISVRSSVTYGNHCCTFSTAHALLWKYKSIPPSQCFATSILECERPTSLSYQCGSPM